ncbi:hypothetical protein BDEG_22962 [Batrachochytrium dendrobatidis JEL423]|uniref:UBC core domain-containing protein n=1 Tax=Batrachochytrium dendrobatidis (strain JEL423) TaxID=403673 RepID=A0A177WHV7_BATDL|nr:hypothetical protein BDEG_22962 [Batrachochytrium dendrobatidis JEL423]
MEVIKRIAREVADIKANPPEGILIIEDESNILDIQAWIQGPGVFLTQIFHPNVSESGEICVSTLKKDWKSEFGIKHILLTIKCLLIVPNPESALNEEAGRLILEDYEEFSKHAILITKIYGQNPDIVFTNSEGSNTASDDKKSATKTIKAIEKEDGNQLGKSSVQKRSAESALDGSKTTKVTLDKRRTLRRLNAVYEHVNQDSLTVNILFLITMTDEAVETSDTPVWVTLEDVLFASVLVAMRNAIQHSHPPESEEIKLLRAHPKNDKTYGTSRRGKYPPSRRLNMAHTARTVKEQIKIVSCELKPAVELI